MKRVNGGRQEAFFQSPNTFLNRQTPKNRGAKIDYQILARPEVNRTSERSIKCHKGHDRGRAWGGLLRHKTIFGSRRSPPMQLLAGPGLRSRGRGGAPSGFAAHARCLLGVLVTKGTRAKI